MRPVHGFFFGNWFYGFCAVALCVEAGFQQRYPLNPFHFYAAVFAATVFFYTAAYVTEGPGDAHNRRSVWYAHNRRLVKATQAALALFLCGYGVWFAVANMEALLHLPFADWLLLSAFPLSGLLYYGLSGKGIGRYNLRRIGWLKPFAIGFTWAGLVTVYPVLYQNILKATPYQASLLGIFLFVKNFMFVTVLCVLFDIKDYAADHNLRIKTFVVAHGLRRTLFFIVLPLCVLGLGFYIAYALAVGFPSERIVFNTIPFLLLTAVAYSMHRRHSIFYYLIIIDGLMLVKALCGMAGMGFH